MGNITSPLPEQAKKVVGDALQGGLIDMIDLSLVGKQAHWNLLGKHFRSIHLQLDEMVAFARTWTDTLAERAVAIGVSPDGRAATVVAQSQVQPLEAGWIGDSTVITALSDRLLAIIGRMRERMAATEEPDPVSQDLFIELLAELEKIHWMVQAQQ